MGADMHIMYLRPLDIIIGIELLRFDAVHRTAAAGLDVFVNPADNALQAMVAEGNACFEEAAQVLEAVFGNRAARTVQAIITAGRERIEPQGPFYLRTLAYDQPLIRIPEEVALQEAGSTLPAEVINFTKALLDGKQRTVEGIRNQIRARNSEPFSHVRDVLALGRLSPGLQGP